MDKGLGKTQRVIAEEFPLAGVVYEKDGVGVAAVRPELLKDAQPRRSARRDPGPDCNEPRETPQLALATSTSSRRRHSATDVVPPRCP